MMRLTSRRLVIGVTALMLAFVSTPAAASWFFFKKPEKPAPTLSELLEGEDFDTLRTVLSNDFSMLIDVLEAADKVTLFAPTDDAFAKLPPEVVEELLADPKGALTDVLLYHAVVGKKLRARRLLRAYETETALAVDEVAGTVAVYADHSGVFVNRSGVIDANVKIANGVVHVIDTVLNPEDGFPATVIDAVARDKRGDTLLDLLDAQNLTEVLENEDGDFTLFAPTAKAFDKLPDEPIPGDVLTTILTYHVVIPSLTAAELLDEGTVPTFQGESVRVGSFFRQVFVNRSRVVSANVASGNGIVHFLNRVLIPPSLDAPPPAREDDDDDD